MKNNSLISVIVPAYNVEKYISRCLDSILNQTYKNLEIIVIDDGSTDNTSDVIKQYENNYQNINGIYQQNQGVSMARINGIKRASGNWIGFVDSDDEIENDMYEILLDNALRHNADISHCGYQMVFDNKINYFYNTGNLVLQDNLSGIKDLLEGSFVEPGLWNKLFNRKLFNNLLNENLIDMSIKINEDLLVNYFLFKESHKSVFIDQCKYHYIVRSNSASRSKLSKNKIYDPIKVKNIILNDINEELQAIAKKVYIRTIINVYNSLVLVKSKRFDRDKNNVYNLIKKNKQYIPYLDKRQKLVSYMIVFLPKTIYKKIYKLYVNKFQRKVYE